MCYSSVFELCTHICFKRHSFLPYKKSIQHSTMIKVERYHATNIYAKWDSFERKKKVYLIAVDISWLKNVLWFTTILLDCLMLNIKIYFNVLSIETF